MPIIGNPITQAAFLVDTFNGTGSQTIFGTSVAPANTASVIVSVHGLVQDPSTYSVNGSTLTFTQAPPAGTGNISARYLGIPASGVTTTAYRTYTEFTATSNQTTFTPPSYTVGFIQVYRNGSLLGNADYTATNGTTVILAQGAVSGDLVAILSFYISSILNAIPATAGAVGSAYLAGNLILSGTTTASTITSAGATALTLQTNAGGTTAVTLLANGNVGVGTTNPARLLDVNGAANVTGNFTGTTGSFSSYLTMGTLVSADPGSNFYSFANRIGSTTGFQNGVSIGQGANTYTAPPSNGLLVYGDSLHGTTATAGSFANTAAVVGGTFRTANGTQSVPNATATTFATLTQPGIYIVQIYIASYQVNAWSAWAIVGWTGSGGQPAYIMANNTNTGSTWSSTAITVTSSTTAPALQVTQSGGATFNMPWSVTRFA